LGGKRRREGEREKKGKGGKRRKKEGKLIISPVQLSPMVLYYNCRQYTKDFILQSELEDFVNHQILTQLIPSFTTTEKPEKEDREELRGRDARKAGGDSLEEEAEAGSDDGTPLVPLRGGANRLEEVKVEVEGKGTMVDKMFENSGQLYYHMMEDGCFHCFG
jgi:hypothetical protein